MKRTKSLILSLFPVFLFLFIVAACQDQSNISNPESNSLNTTLRKIADNDESIRSFEPNYNEGEALQLFKGLAKEIYPVKIGQRLKIVSSDFIEVSKTDVEALYQLTQVFDGDLLIYATEAPPTQGLTQTTKLYTKPIKTTVTRFIKYAKVNNTGDDKVDWKIIAVSLPQGGTAAPKVNIVKVKLETTDGKIVEITSPNQYFFELGRNNGMGNNGMGNNGNGMMGGFGTGSLMSFTARQQIKITVTVESEYTDDDFITLTYGATMMGGTGNGMMNNRTGMMNGNSMNNGNHFAGFNTDNRLKEKFDIKDVKQVNGKFVRTYEKLWSANFNMGFMHAVINAMPKSSIFDDTAPAEENTWGIPYSVK